MRCSQPLSIEVCESFDSSHMADMSNGRGNGCKAPPESMYPRTHYWEMTRSQTGVVNAQLALTSHAAYQR